MPVVYDALAVEAFLVDHCTSGESASSSGSFREWFVPTVENMPDLHGVTELCRLVPNALVVLD